MLFFYLYNPPSKEPNNTQDWLITVAVTIRILKWQMFNSLRYQFKKYSIMCIQYVQINEISL